MDDIARRLADRWAFSPREELEAGWCSRVYADENRVLKVPWRGEEMTSGYRAAFDLSGWFGPEVYQGDESTGAVLMDRVFPGTNLDVPLNELDAREVAVGLIEQLRRVNPAGYPTLREYYANYSHPLLDRLLESEPARVFLHGDLHHFNILWSQEDARWVPIDPKGVSGDPAYEPIAFLRNSLHPLEEVPQLIRSRIDFFAERLALDPWRIAAWCLTDQWAALAEDPEEIDSPEAQTLRAALEEIVGWG